MPEHVYPSGFRWVTRDYQLGYKRWELWAPNGKHAADIWENGRDHYTWHTYDESGVGGENSAEATLHIAKMACESALLRAGWHIAVKKKRGRKAA
jgi:hypothetical protein